MKRKNGLLAIGVLLIFISCEKEYSLENSGNNGSGLIVGIDCRISKIAYTDTTTHTGIGSMTANINNLDVVTRVTLFDSLSFTISYISSPVSANDTVYINADEYFIVDITTKRIKQLHGLTDPTDPFSPQFDQNYFYNASGYLVTKFYSYTNFPGIPVYITSYTYVGAKLTHMSRTEVATGDLVMDADINYHNNIFPNRFLYLFPDEVNYTFFTQFYNFGVRPSNAPRDITVRYYDPGNVLRDSTVSTFSNYIMSRDNYVLSVQMGGDDLISIPAPVGRLDFSYKCK
jgi:hypothetical protein